MENISSACSISLYVRIVVKVSLNTSLRIFSWKMHNGTQSSIIMLVPQKEYRNNLDELLQRLSYG